jgi:hypothetical protein
VFPLLFITGSVQDPKVVLRLLMHRCAHLIQTLNDPAIGRLERTGLSLSHCLMFRQSE